MVQMPQVTGFPLLLLLQNPLKIIFHHGHDPKDRNKCENLLHPTIKQCNV